MNYTRILRGLAGLGAHKLGKKLEKVFEGGQKLPTGVCACSKWQASGHPTFPTKAAGIHSAYWRKTCRGPGHTRFAVTITEPGIEFRQEWKGKKLESGFDQRTLHYAAEAEIDVYDAPNGGADVDYNWRHRRRRHLGYFKTVAAAKRAAEATAGRWCKQAMKRDTDNG